MQSLKKIHAWAQMQDPLLTFYIFIMFSLIPSDANDPQGLMRRFEPNKQTNKYVSFISTFFEFKVSTLS